MFIEFHLTVLFLSPISVLYLPRPRGLAPGGRAEGNQFSIQRNNVPHNYNTMSLYLTHVYRHVTVDNNMSLQTCNLHL